jgi:multiple sugar transport system permease protein
LQSYIEWRSLDLGTSAAIAYSLLILVTVIVLAYVNLLRSKAAEE